MPERTNKVGWISWLNELTDANTPAWMTAIARWMSTIVFLNVAVAVAKAVLSRRPWMIFFEDDFFYYLKVAQNIAHGHGSTFNGLVQTNGYHPLWLLALTGLSFFSGDPRVIAGFVAVVSAIATMSTFLLAEQILKQAGVSYVLRRGLAGYIGIYALHIFYTGMEVILAVPLVFLFLVVANRRDYWQRGVWESFTLGLILSAMILARLDLLLFPGLLLFWVLLNREVRKSITPQHLTGIALGLIPVAAYFLFNHFHFHTWLPVSGMAKQVKIDLWPTVRPWRTVYNHNINNLLNLGTLHLGVLGMLFAWKRLTANQRVLFPTALMFPFVYVFTLSCVSDWQLWLWYLYPERAALCVTFVILCVWPLTAKFMRMRLVAAVVLAIAVGETVTSEWWTDVQPPIHDAALDIQRFARTHPGTYAMGDRSGMVAYLIPDPIVQTEGLVMDRNFLERMRRQEALLPVLNSYHVRYYVTTSWKAYTGCFHALEPFQAGKTSAHMEGTFCSTPVATAMHETYQTLIFDLENEKAAASSQTVAAN